jgi:hypothetical protein
LNAVTVTHRKTHLFAEEESRENASPKRRTLHLHSVRGPSSTCLVAECSRKWSSLTRQRKTPVTDMHRDCCHLKKLRLKRLELSAPPIAYADHGYLTEDCSQNPSQLILPTERAWASADALVQGEQIMQLRAGA